MRFLVENYAVDRLDPFAPADMARRRFTGFLVMTTSAFKMNVDLGLMTVLSIVFALILDFLFLPALLMLGRSRDERKLIAAPQAAAA